MPSRKRSDRAKLEVLGRVTPYRGDGSGSPLFGGTSRSSSGPRRDGRTTLIVFLVLVALGVGYGILHNRLSNAGKTDPALNGVRTVAAPFAVGTARAGHGAKTLWDYIFPGKTDVEELAHLQAENTRLKLENETLHNAEEEATRLRKALGFLAKVKRPLLSAEVLALLPAANTDTILLSRGTHDGVKVGSVARTADGLVGQVTEVGTNTSQVMLLSDASSGVGVLVRRIDPKTGVSKDKAVAVVRGRGRGQSLSVVYLRREDDVRPGDTIISSGFGGVIPAGIPVGTITEIVTEKQGFVKSARVEPFAPMPGTLREVFLIR